MIKISLVKYIYPVFIILGLLLIQRPAIAQETKMETPTVSEVLKAHDEEQVKEDEQKPKEQVPYDRLNRGTPRGSVMSLSESISEGEQDIVMDFLDMRQVPNLSSQLLLA